MVPKFGSFKPKAARSSAPVGPSERNDRRQRVEVEASSHRGSKPRQHGHSGENNDESSRTQRSLEHHHAADRHHSRKQERTVSESAAEAAMISAESADSELFIVDRRGDRKNVEYGSLHRYSVPSYHRTGYGRLVGLPTRTKIDREQSSEKSAVLFRTDGSAPGSAQRPLRSKALKFDERKLRVIANPVATNELEEQTDFIPFRSTLKRKRGSGSPEPASSMTVDYRDIEGKAQESEHLADDDLNWNTDSGLDASADEVEVQVRLENGNLSRETKQAPQDISAWLKLIEHQAKVIRPHGGGLTTSEKRTVADLRLSIYEQALRFIRFEQKGQERLLLGMLKEGALVWETSRLNAAWEKTLKQFPGSILLWTSYLDVVQTDYVKFRFEECKGTYVKCLQILDRARKARETTDDDLVQAQLYALLRLTCFMRDAGYDELSHSVWQLVFEYHIFRPSGIPNGKDGLESLEAFWDADVPRIGEEGAQGWSQHAAHPDEGAPRSVSKLVSRQEDFHDPYQTFAIEESANLHHLHLPAAADDDSDPTDPFRQVLFSDVRSVVATLLDSLPVPVLLNAWSAYSGLPSIPYPDVSSLTLQWPNDQYVRQDANHSSGLAILQPTLSTSLSLITDVATCGSSTTNDHHPAEVEARKYTRRVLEQIMVARPADDILAEFYLAYVAHSDSGEAAATAKRLLKARPTSLRLYNAYALLEAQSGSESKAISTWMKTIKMSKELSEETRSDVVLLWHSFACKAMEAGEENLTLRIMLALVEGEVAPAPESGDTAAVTAAERLKARQFFGQEFERMQDGGRLDFGGLYAECHTQFAYLAEGQTLEPAFEVAEKYLWKLAVEGAATAREQLYQAIAGLVQHHLKHRRAYKPAVIHAVLAKGLRGYPGNRTLLDAYSSVRSHTSIQDRMRSSLEDDILVEDKQSVITWTHLLDEEIRRHALDPPRSTEASIRAMFGRALLRPDSALKHSIALWTMWLRWEAPVQSLTDARERVPSSEQRDTALTRARQVFLDGLRHLPWSKVWVITGMQLFVEHGGMTASGLRQVYNVLLERELRIRVDVDELNASSEAT